MRVDDRQRLVEENGGHILAHQSPAQRNLLLGVGGQAAGAFAQVGGQIQDVGDLVDARPDLALLHLAVAQREGQIVEDRHGVIEHRKLKDLRDVALLRRQGCHVPSVEEHAALARSQKARDDVEHGGLAASAGPQEGVGSAVFPDRLHLLERVILVACGIGPVTVGDVFKLDFGHVEILYLAPAAKMAGQAGALTRRSSSPNT